MNLKIRRSTTNQWHYYTSCTSKKIIQMLWLGWRQVRKPFNPTGPSGLSEVVWSSVVCLKPFCEGFALPHAPFPRVENAGRSVGRALRWRSNFYSVWIFLPIMLFKLFGNRVVVDLRPPHTSKIILKSIKHRSAMHACVRLHLVINVQ